MRALQRRRRGGGVAYASWTTAERLRFLDGLPRAACRATGWRRSTRAFGLSQSGNAEVLFAWLQLALANRYQPAVPAAERFLATRAGASSSLPLFQTLLGEGEWGRPIAETPGLCPNPRRIS